VCGIGGPLKILPGGVIFPMEDFSAMERCDDPGSEDNFVVLFMSSLE
jgi:hypothetical protein